MPFQGSPVDSLPASDIARPVLLLSRLISSSLAGEGRISVSYLQRLARGPQTELLLLVRPPIKTSNTGWYTRFQR